MYTSEEQELSCNCTRSIVGKAIALYPSSDNQYKLLWIGISSGFIVSSDLGGCYCSKIVNAVSASKHGTNFISLHKHVENLPTYNHAIR